MIIESTAMKADYASTMRDLLMRTFSIHIYNIDILETIAAASSLSAM